MKVFPQKYPQDPLRACSELNPIESGMDLRDYFAAKAMVLTRWTDAETSAKFCYIVADELMKAREDV